MRRPHNSRVTHAATDTAKAMNNELQTAPRVGSAQSVRFAARVRLAGSVESKEGTMKLDKITTDGLSEDVALNGGRQRVYEYDNGYGASVIEGGFIARGMELAVLKRGSLAYDTPITSGVIGFMSVDDANETLAQIKALPNADEGTA